MTSLNCKESVDEQRTNSQELTKLLKVILDSGIWSGVQILALNSNVSLCLTFVAKEWQLC